MMCSRTKLNDRPHIDRLFLTPHNSYQLRQDLSRPPLKDKIRFGGERGRLSIDLDHNRAASQIASKTGKAVASIEGKRKALRGTGARA